MNLFDKVLDVLGLMRQSQQPVKNLKIYNVDEGKNYLVVELANGFRWSGYQDREAVEQISAPYNPLL